MHITASCSRKKQKLHNDYIIGHRFRGPKMIKKKKKILKFFSIIGMPWDEHNESDLTK